jgi:SAM-dependent methyltransferase
MSGAVRILLYNWPAYALTWIGAVAVAATARGIGGAIGWLLVLGAAVAAAWSAVSLLVSHYVYDRSPLAGGAWLRAFTPERVEAWASIDAGLDAEVALDEVMPGTCLARIDVYDPNTQSSPSVRRARVITPRAHDAVSAPPSSLPLADGSCDVIAVVFTAHEIRDVAERERFFVEVNRALRPGGRMVLVEHLRDLPNFLAFGPGFTHFVRRAEWLRIAGVADLAVAAEARVTPWVMALALEKRS